MREPAAEALFEGLETPCALVEVGAMERNLSRVARAAETAGIAMRPHAKGHKCPAIVARQRRLGATGITVATLDEAAGMARAGVEDILLYYPSVGKAAVERLFELTELARISTTVESAEEADRLDAAARARGVVMDVLIDVDTGLGRTGVAVGDELWALAVHVERLAGLRLAGVGTHEGFAYSVRDPAERGLLVEERLGEFAAAGRRLGVETVSCGATPSIERALEVEGITEIRPGNYALMDRIQVDLSVTEPEDCAFTVLSTVISVRDAGRATVDAGSKALTSDLGAHGTGQLQGHGMIRERPELGLPNLSEEHGFLTIEGGVPMEVDERIRIIPNHSCAAVACFGSLVFVNGDSVVDIEHLAGRRGAEARP